MSHRTLKAYALSFALALAYPTVCMADAFSQSSYQLGPNDEIQVVVYGQPEYPIKTHVKSDGTIVLPYIGKINADGKTTGELGSMISDALRAGGYLNNPSVNVDVTTYVSKTVTVLGNVLTPGVYPLDRPQSAAMMIARAGGVRAGGADSVLISHAGGGTAVRISLSDFTSSENATQTLLPGDTLFVPTAEVIYVYGQVNTPGAYPIQPGMTYRQALAKAGGPTLAGSTHKIEVRRKDKKLEGVGLDDQIKPDDVMIIKEKMF